MVPKPNKDLSSAKNYRPISLLSCLGKLFERLQDQQILAAFDKFWHDGIRYKLHKNNNLPDRLVRVLSSFLTDRTLQVSEMGLFSRVINLRAGTPQGSSLSSLIYIISVNDLPTGDQRGSSQYQFADDIAVCASRSNGVVATQKLQGAVDDIEGWCRKWRVKLNGDKSRLVVISRK